MTKQYVDLKWRKGTELVLEDQKKALGLFVHRFTATHKPQWANTPKPDGTPYKPQFRSDEDWLANTRFVVLANGRLSKEADYCESTPTWPNGQ